MFDLPKNRFQVIYADPAWTFITRSDKGKGKSPEQHYGCMSLGDIQAMPVADLAAPDCALFMWATDPLLPQALDTIEAWGFTFKTVAFTWAKQARVNHEKWHMGTGYYTRANPEMCLLATRGRPQRVSRGVRQLIVAPVREHSRKPDEAYAGIEALFAGPYCELFARTERPGWTSWGNQTGRFKPKDAASNRSII